MGCGGNLKNLISSPLLSHMPQYLSFASKYKSQAGSPAWILITVFSTSGPWYTRCTGSDLPGSFPLPQTISPCKPVYLDHHQDLRRSAFNANSTSISLCYTEHMWLKGYRAKFQSAWFWTTLLEANTRLCRAALQHPPGISSPPVRKNHRQVGTWGRAATGRNKP